MVIFLQMVLALYLVGGAYTGMMFLLLNHHLEGGEKITLAEGLATAILWPKFLLFLLGWVEKWGG